jgi:hypothetical protein
MTADDAVRLASEVDSCDVILDDIALELCFEIEHNDREGHGNKEAIPLFRTMWDSLCSLSPLIRKALNGEDDCIMQGECAGNNLQEVLVCIREIDRLFLRHMDRSIEARDLIVLLYGRVYYLRQKLLVALQDSGGAQLGRRADSMA